MGVYSSFAFVFFLAVIVTFLYTSTRHNYRKVPDEDLKTIVPVITLSSVLFALLATFTISNLWRRYQDIRQYLVMQWNKLRMLYRALKSMPETDKLKMDLKRYAKSLATTELKYLAKEKHNSETELLYDQLVDDILHYTRSKERKNRFVVFGNLYNEECGEQLLTPEINHALYFIIIISAIFTLGSFWFINIVDGEVQFIVDLFVITVIGLVLYIIHELMNPFDSELLKQSFDCIYSDFLVILNKDLPEH